MVNEQKNERKEKQLEEQRQYKDKKLINQGRIKNKITSFIPLGDRRVVNSYFL